jgi:hypothetical protein
MAMKVVTNSDLLPVSDPEAVPVATEGPQRPFIPA